MDIKRYMAVLICLVSVGCSSPTVYQLAVSPEGDAMRRELMVVNGGVEEMLRTIYDEAVTEDGQLRYSGNFDTVPADIGGSGTWLRVASPVGSVYAYAERFRGDDDLVGQIEARLLATDRFTDFLVAWFGSELSDDPHWPVLREFMDTRLRHDMKNLSLYVLELERQGVEGETWGAVYFARVGQYLVDRGYLDDADVLSLMRLIALGGPNWADPPSPGLLQRITARRMGLEDGADLPVSLGFLRQDNIEDSWRAFVDLPVCAELVSEWELQASNDTLEDRDTQGAVTLLVFEAAGMEFELFSSPDEVELALTCEVEPLLTNGEWDEKARLVTWNGEVRERFGLPLFFYACWAEPDADYQQAHFGESVIQGKRLVEMVAWYTGLSGKSRERWDGFIGSLDPTQPIRAQVEASRAFDRQEEADPLGRGYNLLLSALPGESD